MWIMEKRMETTGIMGVMQGIYCGYTGILEKVETTVMRSHKHFVFPFSAAASNAHVAAEALWF